MKKVLFGLSLSLVLAMAIGSFAIGETQTPITPQAETQSVAAANDGETGDFVVSGGSITATGGYVEYGSGNIQGLESAAESWEVPAIIN